MATQKQAVHTGGAPAAVGPYSQAVKAGELVICSGQIPIDPANGELVTGDIRAQTHQVMKNLQAVLEASGSGFDRAVRFTIFLTDLGDFGAVNEVYASYLAEPFPARACVQVSALPKGVDVEIDAIALCD